MYYYIKNVCIFAHHYNKVLHTSAKELILNGLHRLRLFNAIEAGDKESPVFFTSNY